MSALLPMTDFTGRRRMRMGSDISRAEKFTSCQSAYRSRFELAVALDVAAQYHKKPMRAGPRLRHLANNAVRCSAAGISRHASRTTTRQSGAGEKAGRKRELPEMVPEMSATRDGFHAQRCRQSGPFSRAANRGEKVSSLAGGATRIRIRGCCLMLASPRASKTIGSSPWRAA